MYTAVMLQRDPQTQRLYLHDAITEKELDIRGTEHLKTHRGSDTTNSELYTADILRNALNVKSRQLSTGRSIDEMAGGHLSNVGHMKEEAFPKIKGSYAENGNGPRGNASTNSIPASSGNVNTNHAAGYLKSDVGFFCFRVFEKGGCSKVLCGVFSFRAVRGKAVAVKFFVGFRRRM